ncbi:MAG TPA: hypothetical protein VFE53_15405 [Mucilaginibacter sp.]|jgi:hypothetical protein|nr:hypothetical protein [Mucilaginibacter sp.]
MKSIKTAIAIAAAGVLMFNTTRTQAQQTSAADSALLDRVSALEQQVANTKPGEDHLMVAGLTTIGYVTGKSTNTIGGVSTTTRTSTFGNSDTYEFSPMFLWRHSDKFLMEFEPSFNNDGLGVNWADVSYFAAPGLILRAGYMVVPFGIYNKRLAAGWIDKLATDPIGIPGSTDYGFEAMGGFPLGSTKWSYDVGVFNGQQLLPDGELQTAGITDNNINKTFSGRLGFLPFSNSSLEVGVSALTGKVGDEGSVYANTRTNMYAFDLSTVQKLNPFTVNIKAQYNIVNTDRENYLNPSDSTQTYSYNNHSTSGFGIISLRPSYVDDKFWKNVEASFRWADYITPANSAWGSNTTQVTEGVAYWISWRTVVKLTHEAQNGNSTVNQMIAPTTGNTKTDYWFLQFSIQL